MAQQTTGQLRSRTHYLITPISYYRHDPVAPGAAYRPGKHADQIMNDYYRETALKALAATQRRTR